jgi:putative SOS response-associated peptidase YedK
MCGRFTLRTPATLVAEAFGLDTGFNLQPLLRPFPSGEMTAYPVSTVVNNPKNDVEECVEALQKRLEPRRLEPTR